MWNGSHRTLGRVVEEFVMKQAMVPYLFTFVVGRLGHREVGPRTRLYTEAVTSLLDGVAWEFVGMETYVCLLWSTISGFKIHYILILWSPTPWKVDSR